MPDFKLPDLGEGVTEAEVDRWLVKEGDTIAEDDPLVELITDKATAEVPSPFAGTVKKIHVEQGAVVPVGTILVTIEGDDEERSPSGGRLRPPKGAEPPPQAQAEPVGGGPPAAPAREVKAVPPVRRLAREMGVDLAQIRGTGPGGSILRSDVIAFAEGAGKPAVATTTGAERREPLRGIRRTIADRMTHAHQAVPPVTHVEECDVTELDATRNLANERAPDLPRLTFLPFIVRAVVHALKDHPAINSSLDEDAGEIVFHDRYSIGVAVDTPSGLMVPVVHDADKKRLREIAMEIDRLAKAARDGSLSLPELQGGTFTVTSPGPFGGLMATPIILHPQAAILGVHKASERPVVRDGQIVIRKMMNMSITFDHRILDGLTASKFLLDVVKLLEHPAVLALEV